MALEYGTEEWEREYQAEVQKRLENPQPYIYFTPEWIALYEKAIQNDEKYKEAAKDWEGTVVLHVLPAPEYGLEFDLYVLMDLWHGECRSVRIVPPEVGEAGDYVITGTLERWTQVGKGELDTTKGMMQGKLKLKGDLPTIVRSVRAATRLTEIASEVGGIYPTEMPPEEIEPFRAYNNALAEKFLGIKPGGN